jgi:hypothetical protein
MARPNLNPDVTRRADAPYWAAATVLALQDGDEARAEIARRHLRRLGYTVGMATCERRPRQRRTEAQT